MSTYKQEYYAENRERLKAASRAYYAANRERCKERQREYRSRNPEIVRANVREWQKNNKEKKRASSIASRRRKNGFAGDLFNERLNAQNHRCAICRVTLNSSLTLTAATADHCHISNLPRGVLCKRCNLLLGHAKDDPVVLEAAARYLRQYNGDLRITDREKRTA